MVLVEGAKTDVALMKNIFCLYDIDVKYEIVSYCTNIYTLYREMFRYGIEEFDILQVLKSREKDIAKKKIFDEKYTDILLIFDLDPQDPQFDSDHIKFMHNYFCESSDMGKLYLNYPMVEAFYHLQDIPDPNYFDRKASLEELINKKYKERVNQETKNKEYRKFITNKEDCTTVILQNLSKSMFLSTGEVIEGHDILIKDYNINLNAVLEQQLLLLDNYNFVYVLCTCVLYIIVN